MANRAVPILLAVVALLLALNIAGRGGPDVQAQTIGSVARVPTHGNCVGIIAAEGMVLRAFADGTVEAYRLGSGQPDWRPIQAAVAKTERK